MNIYWRKEGITAVPWHEGTPQGAHIQSESLHEIYVGNKEIKEPVFHFNPAIANPVIHPAPGYLIGAYESYYICTAFRATAGTNFP